MTSHDQKWNLAADLCLYVEIKETHDDDADDFEQKIRDDPNLLDFTEVVKYSKSMIC